MNFGIFIISYVLWFAAGKCALADFPLPYEERVRQTAAAKPPLSGMPSDYPGEPLPGNKAVIFAKGIISDGNLHGRLAISPDGRDMFWTKISATAGGDLAACIMHIAKTGEGWTLPHIAPLAAAGMTANPLFSPDGSRLFFNFAPDPAKGWQTRVVRRTGQGWSEPEEGCPMLNPSSSFTGSGRVYYTDVMKGKPWNRGIYCAELNDNTYADAKALPASINSKFIDYTPFIAPDESYLMFSSSRPSEKEEMNLHISFRSAEGTWSTPRRMNDALGYPGFARFPSISPDGKFLFFCGDDGNMHWVKSEVISSLREK